MTSVGFEGSVLEYWRPCPNDPDEMFIIMQSAVQRLRFFLYQNKAASQRRLFQFLVFNLG